MDKFLSPRLTLMVKGSVVPCAQGARRWSLAPGGAMEPRLRAAGCGLRPGCLAAVRPQRVVRSCLVRSGPSPPAAGLALTPQPAGGLAAPPPRPSVWLPGWDWGGAGQGRLLCIASSLPCDRNRRKRTARRGPSTKIRPNAKHCITHQDKTTANVWSTATSFYYYIIFVDDSFFAKYL